MRDNVEDKRIVEATDKVSKAAEPIDSRTTSFVPISLPSQCLSYPEINPEDIKARAYQGSDEEYLCQLNPLNLEKNYLEVMKRVIQGIDPAKLTVGDRLYFMVWECINSYMDTIRVKTICGNCFQEVEISVNLADLNIIKLPDDYKEPYEISLPSGKQIRLRLLTVGDEIEIDRYRKKHGESHNYRYARSIVSDDDIVEKLKQMGKISVKDMATIRAFHEKFYHGPDFYYKYTCPKSTCEEVDEVEVPFRLELLFPTGETLTQAFGEEL